MNEEVKKVWVAKLRSGEVKQGKGSLGTPDGKRCCLGVLCDLAVEAGVIDPPVIDKPFDNDDEENLFYGAAITDNLSLPIEVKRWAGLPDVIGTINRGKYADQPLSDLNDGCNRFAQKYVQLNFKEIADVIEEVF